MAAVKSSFITMEKSLLQFVVLANLLVCCAAKSSQLKSKSYKSIEGKQQGNTNLFAHQDAPLKRSSNSLKTDSIDTITSKSAKRLNGHNLFEHVSESEQSYTNAAKFGFKSSKKSVGSSSSVFDMGDAPSQVHSSGASSQEKLDSATSSSEANTALPKGSKIVPASREQRKGALDVHGDQRNITANHNLEESHEEHDHIEVDSMLSLIFASIASLMAAIGLLAMRKLSIEVSAVKHHDIKHHHELTQDMYGQIFAEAHSRGSKLRTDSASLPASQSRHLISNKRKELTPDRRPSQSKSRSGSKSPSRSRSSPSSSCSHVSSPSSRSKQPPRYAHQEDKAPDFVKVAKIVDTISSKHGYASVRSELTESTASASKVSSISSSTPVSASASSPSPVRTNRSRTSSRDLASSTTTGSKRAIPPPPVDSISATTPRSTISSHLSLEQTNQRSSKYVDFSSRIVGLSPNRATLSTPIKEFERKNREKVERKIQPDLHRTSYSKEIEVKKMRFDKDTSDGPHGDICVVQSKQIETRLFNSYTASPLLKFAPPEESVRKTNLTSKSLKCTSAFREVKDTMPRPRRSKSTIFREIKDEFSSDAYPHPPPPAAFAFSKERNIETSDAAPSTLRRSVAPPAKKSAGLNPPSRSSLQKTPPLRRWDSGSTRSVRFLDQYEVNIVKPHTTNHRLPHGMVVGGAGASTVSGLGMHSISSGA